MKTLTRKRLRAVLSYDLATGLFCWKAKTSSMAHRCKIGAVAGNPNTSGHLQIMIDGKFYLAHRLAWLFVLGQWPNKEVDHINGNPSDNRWCNLRLATRSQNIANSKIRSDSKNLLKGVRRFSHLSKYGARIVVAGKSKHLGLFETQEAAHAAYVAAAKRHFGEFARAH